MKQYEAVAMVYAKDMGPVFARPAKRTIEAETVLKALDIAIKDFKEYCNELKENHGNEFECSELEINEIEEEES